MKTRYIVSAAPPPSLTPFRMKRWRILSDSPRAAISVCVRRLAKTAPPGARYVVTAVQAACRGVGGRAATRKVTYG